MNFFAKLRLLGSATKPFLASLYKTAKWHVRRPPVPLTIDGAVNLHLGCGYVIHDAFINIDLAPHPHVHYRRPIDDLSNFADESVDLIYASHCLEHFSFRRVPYVLTEWRRVLKKGGVLRLSVPNFDAILQIYHLSSNRLDLIQQAIVGGQDYAYNFHYVVFNSAYLKEQLEQVGFNQVSDWTPGASDLTTFDDWSNKSFAVGDRSIPISLNLEAIK